MFGAMLLIVFKGTSDLGGLSVVIMRNLESGRIEIPSYVLLTFCKEKEFVFLLKYLKKYIYFHEMQN